MNYKKIFWGIIFLFDFRIGGFDILPDIIGYILIVVGLAAIISRSSHYVTARSVAVPMIFISILDIYQRPVESGFMQVYEPGILMILVGLVSSVLTIVMIHGICFGISEEAAAMGLDDLSSKAQSRWTLYLVLAVITTIGTFIPFLMGILFIPLFVLLWISFILILNLLKRAETSIWGNPLYNVQL